MHDLLGELDPLLEEALRIVSSWTAEQLELATALPEQGRVAQVSQVPHPPLQSETSPQSSGLPPSFAHLK